MVDQFKREEEHYFERKWVKLNTNGYGASKEKCGIVGCGGLICGVDGEWLGCFSKGNESGEEHIYS